MGSPKWGEQTGAWELLSLRTGCGQVTLNSRLSKRLNSSGQHRRGSGRELLPQA